MRHTVRPRPRSNGAVTPSPTFSTRRSPRLAAALVATTATAGLAALAGPALAAPPAAGPTAVPTLEGRALLAPDATAPAPFPGAPNTDPAPAPGSTQPVGGFSALIDAPGRDTYWAMPDNGFGSKANSRSFLLRVYRVRTDLRTARGGSGNVEVLDEVTLRDPDGRIPFGIVNGATSERLLTGGDLDLESMRVDGNGDLWFGEEFGPFIVHTDATGKVLEAPIPLPGVRSPDYPADAPGAGPATLGRSSGFEGMAISKDGKTLYPVLEGAVTGDDPTTRRVYAFDLRTRRYTDRLPDYRVADRSYLVSDLTALDAHRFVALERDNAQGAGARHKRGFVVDLRRRAADGTIAKREVVDLLDIADPAGISTRDARPGDIGLGNPFSMPYFTIEAVLPVGGNRLAIVNDTNFGSTGRNPSLPDPSDFVVLDVPGLRGDGARGNGHGGGEARTRSAAAGKAQGGSGGKAASTLAVIGDTPYGDEQRAAFPELVQDVNADPKVRGVLHVGDIKNGSSTCTTERFEDLRGLYDTFADPFLYTPGDNEWTDCHRPAAGGFLPTERLAALREVFYPTPGVSTGGRPQRVSTQASDPRHAEFVENVRWNRSDVTFATVHVVGSNNGRQPWFGAAETPEQRTIRLAEVERREAAALAWIDEAFADATRRDASGVVLAMQADTIIGTREGFEAINARIERLASRFDGEVLLLQGDTHRYLVDRPFAGAPNLTRLVVEGETADEWLRLTVDPRGTRLFSWTRERVSG